MLGSYMRVFTVLYPLVQITFLATYSAEIQDTDTADRFAGERYYLHIYQVS